jgi:hypothetical protein
MWCVAISFVGSTTPSTPLRLDVSIAQRLPPSDPACAVIGDEFGVGDVRMAPEVMAMTPAVGRTRPDLSE